MANDAESGPYDYSLIGVGNALVDIIGHVDDHFLTTHALAKGAMTLVDGDTAQKLHERIGSVIEASGGSAANTMYGAARFGARAAYIGKVADDALGLSFREDMTKAGVAVCAKPSASDVPTGRCIIAVTPDAQRTMSTFLGASSLLSEDDLDLEAIAASQVLYLEGYLFDRSEAKDAFRAAAEVAHAHGRQVALTLSDSFCVERHRTDFLDLLRGDVDILFGNSTELQELYQTRSLPRAMEHLGRDCLLAAITAGADGSYLVTSDDVSHVAAHPAADVVDTTGAGDMYAAGFLYGYTSGRSALECAALGSRAAAEVIAHVGSRPDTDLTDLL